MKSSCEDLTLFVEGELGSNEAATFRLHLADCASCQAGLEDTLQVQHLVAQLGSSAKRSRRGMIYGATLALAAGLALAFVMLKPKADFAIRGGETAGETSWIRVFVKHGDEVAALQDRIRGGDGLLFAYTNLRESERDYLFIAGRDAKGRLHWYHPAYKTAGDDPISLHIDRGAADRKLAEVVFADHAPGKLEICAVFSRQPLRIEEIDRVMEAGGDWPKDEPRDCHSVEVEK